ncbi:zinc-ribbon domain-containing protein [Bifidobacterium bifidum]|uniref:zinc-ribbon domain-containing protein n=1 Tax=Bifidobacterium bifidum TaxID=1681 RepID=UPI000658CF28|nr:zinc-ribbon domain-containing protein [Bifidobacterium bifidum]KLN85028.1 hypothetical protein IF1010_0928 [Bifidobacterium bifidum]
MRCSRCGANVVEGDRFCENCGAPVAVQAGSVCPVCGQQSEPGMRFCQQCGAELSAGPQPAQPVPTAQPVPPAQPYQAVQQYAGQYGAAQPGAVFPPQAVQPPAQPSRPGESAGKGKKKTALIVGIIIAVLVVALAAGFGVWWFMLRDSGTQSAQTQSTSQQSGKTKFGDSKAAKDDKPCTAAPDAELSSVDHSDANLVAQLQLTSNCALTKDGDTAEFKESDVKVSIKDDEGNVIASAVFDFSKQPVKFNGETANVALEFTTRQYWRPYDQIETGSAEVILQTGQSGPGEAGSADGDALAGSDIDSEDAERYAQLALSWQLKHDESAASRFYTTYTTQLSSKKKRHEGRRQDLALRGHLRAVPAAAHQAQERDPDLVRRLPDVHEGRRFDRVLRDPVG